MMKKVIYGFTILLGIGLISTNFIINDTSNIDHKTVKAGGTACKWISESGYGVGPYYVIDTTCNETGTSCGNATDTTLNDYIELIPCNNSSDVGKTKDGNKLYNSINNDDLFSGYIRFILHYQSSANHPVFLKVEDGEIVHIKTFNNRKTSSYNNSSNIVIDEDNPELFSWHEISLAAAMGAIHYGNEYIQHSTDINGDGEWTFTCVCAEY